MANVAAQLSQWTFEKSTAHPPRTSSAASTPNLADDVSDTLRIDTAAALSVTKKGPVFHERYNSSEEDLTTGGSDSESEYDYDDVVVHDPAKECKYAFAGRPKVVELEFSRFPMERPSMQQRSASLANIPVTPIHLLQKSNKAQRQSMTLNAFSSMASPAPRSVSPAANVEFRRPSTSHSPVTQNHSSLQQIESASTSSSFKTAPSSRSISPAASEPAPGPYLSSSRSSVYVPTQSRLNLTKINTSQSSYRHSQFAPLTPQSPALSFLSSDPYENASNNSSSPIIKKPAHRRLRSISMKLALAKIAITPAKKPYDARLNGTAPSTPLTPGPPQTAPLERPASFASPNKLRRASTILRPKSRQDETNRFSIQAAAPPVPQLVPSIMQQQRLSRMVARGANEREPTLVLPTCPTVSDDDGRSSVKSRALRKRKSLMDFMDSLA